MPNTILTLNVGSSSIKAAVFTAESLNLLFTIKVERLTTAPLFTIYNNTKTILLQQQLTTDHATIEIVTKKIIEWLQQQVITLQAVSHRVVHGGTDFYQPVLTDKTILDQLEKLSPLAPLHEPYNLAAIYWIKKNYPDLPQIICFDTAFHHTCSAVHQTMAIPKVWRDMGIRRYCFHGLSYESAMYHLATIAPQMIKKRLVLAHLGSGASLCGTVDGKSVSTTMAFSALAGLPMATRCGDLDPGALLFLLQSQGISAKVIEENLYKHSGLLGLSGYSDDIRDLLQRNSQDDQLAIAVFVQAIIHHMGATIADLMGVDGFIFTGGIGEHTAVIRQQVMQQMAWLGVKVDSNKNQDNASCISADDSQIPVYVIPCDEELMLAKHAKNMLML